MTDKTISTRPYFLLLSLLIIPSCIKQQEPVTTPNANQQSKGFLDSLYTPTRKEWLEIKMARQIQETLDEWSWRYGVTVSAIEQDSTIYVTVSPAIGQGDVPRSQMDYCKEEVDGIVQRVQGQYPWSAFMKRRVTFMVPIADAGK